MTTQSNDPNSLASGISLKHRMDAVTRVLQGHDAHEVAADLNVSPRLVEQWCKEYCRAGEMRLRQLPENWVERCFTIAEKLVPLATLISVLLAVTLFIQGQRKEAAAQAHAAAQERESRVRDAYTALDDRYLDYVKLCLDHPDLDVFDTPMVNVPGTTPAKTLEQQRRESMILSTLTSILERAFLMYSNPTDDFEHNQWNAWSAYIDAWCTRANFRAEWTNSRREYDANFAAFVDGRIQRVAAKIDAGNKTP